MCGRDDHLVTSHFDKIGDDIVLKRELVYNLTVIPATGWSDQLPVLVSGTSHVISTKSEIPITGCPNKNVHVVGIAWNMGAFFWDTLYKED